MVAMLDSISMKAKLVVEGYIIGQHRSPYHGFSVEFAEHRSYEPGDEVKHIDWKLYGKTNRLYVKRFEEETNLQAHLILDTSKSMTYASGKVTKLDYGSYLLAALSYLMISQQDAAGVILFDEKIRSFIPPKSTPSHLNTLLNTLDVKQPGNDTKIETVLHEMAERINKRGLVVIISDLLDEQPLELHHLIKLTNELLKIDIIPDLEDIDSYLKCVYENNYMVYDFKTKKHRPIINIPKLKTVMIKKIMKKKIFTIQHNYFIPIVFTLFFLIYMFLF